MTRVLVVYCHPVRDSLVGAALTRVLAVLDIAGSEYRLHDLYGDAFEPEPTAASDEVDADPAVRRYVDDLRWCDTLVFVYPTWWAGQPAMLRGWIDRVWMHGVAWGRDEGGGGAAPLPHDIRRLVVVTTHGSPKYVNAFQGEGGKRTIGRGLRSMCRPRAAFDWISLYGVDTCNTRQRSRFLDRVERRIMRLASHRPARPRRPSA